MAEDNDGEIDKDSQEVVDIRNTSSRWSLLSEIVYTLELWYAEICCLSTLMGCACLIRIV